MEYRIMHVGAGYWSRYLAKDEKKFGTWQNACVYKKLEYAKYISYNHDYNTVVVDINGEICY